MNKLNELRDREDGFTLIELLIVVLIIGILAAIAIPVYLGIQNQAKQAAVQADVNSTVTSVQVALTEGATLPASDTGVRSDGDQVTITYTPSATNPTSFTVQGVNSGLNYSYTYSSATGEFVAGTV